MTWVTGARRFQPDVNADVNSGGALRRANARCRRSLRAGVVFEIEARSTGHPRYATPQSLLHREFGALGARGRDWLKSRSRSSGVSVDAVLGACVHGGEVAAGRVLAAATTQRGER